MKENWLFVANVLRLCYRDDELPSNDYKLQAYENPDFSSVKCH